MLSTFLLCREVSQFDHHKINHLLLLYILVPSRPFVVDRSATSTSISLTWSQQSHDFIKGFIVTATYIGPCEEFHNITNTTMLNSSSRHVNLTGLHEYSNYSVTIIALNDAGNNSSHMVDIATESSGKCHSLHYSGHIYNNYLQHLKEFQMVSGIHQYTSLLLQSHGILSNATFKTVLSEIIQFITGRDLDLKL